MIEECLAIKPERYSDIDYPEFNSSIEKVTKKKSESKPYKWSVQDFWAWREARAKKFKSATDLMLCLFPFEPELP